MSLTLEQDTPVVLDGVSWETYLSFGEDAGPGTRMTYDNGRLEIMPPISIGHDKRKSLLADLTTQYLLVRDIPYDRVGQTTLKRQELLKGTDPDDGFYIRPDEAGMPLDVDDLDLAIHPPPNLVIEVDRTSPSIPREPILAALGVSELWRWDFKGDMLSLHRLRDDMTGYGDIQASGLLPDLDVVALAEHVRLGRSCRQSEVVARWRNFLTG